MGKVRSRDSFLLHSISAAQLDLGPLLRKTFQKIKVSPMNRTPYDVWERILLEVIAVNDPPVFDVTCTPSTYLAFKRTCGGGGFVVFDYEYRSTEKDRQSMRLVCRAWNEFADRWDIKNRWGQFWRPQTLMKVPDQEWRCFSRLYFAAAASYIIPRTTVQGAVRPASPVASGSTSKYGPDIVASMLYIWSSVDVGGCGLRLRRLEMLELRLEQFDGVFKALCEASPVLKDLRSLGLSIPGDGEGWVLKMLSIHFPGLVHLTLQGCYEARMRPLPGHSEDEDGKASDSRKHDGLNMKHLEVLFLFTVTSSFRLSNWSLPALQHFHVSPVAGEWNYNILPFLERHAAMIETIDLDGHLSRNKITNLNLVFSHYYNLSTVDFWGTFPRLALLSCNLAQGRFYTYPGNQHALECLVHTQEVMDEKDLVAVLGPWVEEPGIKLVGSIVLFGRYLSTGEYKWNKGRVAGPLQQCKLNGTKLLGPVGKSWLDEL